MKQSYLPLRYEIMSKSFTELQVRASHLMLLDYLSSSYTYIQISHRLLTLYFIAIYLPVPVLPGVGYDPLTVLLPDHQVGQVPLPPPTRHLLDRNLDTYICIYTCYYTHRSNPASPIMILMRCRINE